MSRFKQYMSIINEMNSDNNVNTINQETEKNINIFLEKVEIALKSTHVQNNHFTYGNSGSKFKYDVNQILEKIKQRMYSYDNINNWKEFITDEGNMKSTLVGPINGKWLEGNVLQMRLSTAIGYDYSMNEAEQAKAEKIFELNKDLIDKLWENIKEGLKNAIPLVNENGQIVYYLEKRHGNPKAKFLLSNRKVNQTSIINFIPGQNNDWSDPKKISLFTIYPGKLSTKLDFTKPACLIIPSDQIKNITHEKVKIVTTP